jgi:4-hydroxy-tetrahydrodipicolinate synthase
MEHDIHCGVWPVMLTPFDEDLEIDWRSLEKLIDWYVAAGVHGLFSNCQSSEMFFLSEAESVKLTEFVVAKVDGRVPVVASGHTAATLSHQAEQVAAIAETGVDSVILISNRLASQDDDDEVALTRLQLLVGLVPESTRLGMYECPYPYKRLMSDAMVSWCAASGRFTFIKDTCCNLPTIERRLSLIRGSSLRLANANAQTLLGSLQAGADGYSGVMANFHPELYVWLYENWRKEPEKARILAHYLTVAALVEYLDYPLCPKDFQVSIGNFRTALCRARRSGTYYDNHFPTTVKQMVELGEECRRLLDIRL